MEIIDREDDEYKWLDAEDRTEASFAHRNKVKMITFLEGTWIIKVNHDFDGSDTLLVYYTTNDFLNVEDLGVLFEIAQNQKIRRIIFNKFIFRSRPVSYTHLLDKKQLCSQFYPADIFDKLI